MSDSQLVLLVMSLAGIFLAAAAIRHRGGGAKRGLRLILGAGAAAGGLALIYFSLQDLP